MPESSPPFRAQAAEILSAAMTLKDGRAGKGGLLSGIFG